MCRKIIHVYLREGFRCVHEPNGGAEIERCHKRVRCADPEPGYLAPLRGYCPRASRGRCTSKSAQRWFVEVREKGILRQVGIDPKKAKGKVDDEDLSKTVEADEVKVVEDGAEIEGDKAEEKDEKEKADAEADNKQDEIDEDKKDGNEGEKDDGGDDKGKGRDQAEDDSEGKSEQDQPEFPRTTTSTRPGKKANPDRSANIPGRRQKPHRRRSGSVSSLFSGLLGNGESRKMRLGRLANFGDEPR